MRLLHEDGVGFVVYRAELTYRRGARFGDRIEVRSSVPVHVLAEGEAEVARLRQAFEDHVGEGDELALSVDGHQVDLALHEELAALM